MEQFPASSLSQWDYIKKMIDMSDYYLLIVAGRYGSIDPDENISYTEKEYNYAVEKNIPIIAFLVQDIGSLPVSRAGKTDEERANISRFREKIQNAGRLVDFYSDENDIKYKIATAINKIVKDAPQVGWVRADKVQEALAMAEDKAGFLELQKQIDDLKKAIIEKVEQTNISWEPIPFNDIEALFDKKIDVPALSIEAKKLLVEAAADPAGQILVITTMEGTEIQTNNKTMNNDLTGKDMIRWRESVDELLSNKLITLIGQKNEIYQLTKYGYDVAEKIYV